MNGFTNWNNATTKITKHGSSDFHKACAETLSSTVDIGDMHNKQAITEKQTNREYLLKVLFTVQFLARQGPELRGNGDECDLNVISVASFYVVRNFREWQSSWRESS